MRRCRHARRRDPHDRGRGRSAVVGRRRVRRRGRGDRSREYWLEVHTRFFERTYRALGLDFHAEISVVFERFEVVYDEDWA
ncbi:MAG: hypothetical protein R2710_01305 [Acidimicrobiales bacterium]